ncbi:ATPase synthesis protein 25 mitochondrial [Gnomoniopsis smithogilvyi]|uniref:ATPase synthesis protein 25 n=1 Tax=Gnomoniopsis smithogilvyi TaxID=1191159 RepID=A0A9W8YLJ3_9PEZI|nr:ATPase synthesis protein 25 mitochondrial [Gnomoniopsis smithogilvyi]
MASRPVLRASAAGCSACRSTFMRFIVSPHAPVLPRTLSVHRRMTPSALLLPASFSTRRLRPYSTQNSPAREEEELEDPNEWGESDLKAVLAEKAGRGLQNETEVKDAADSEEAPWYLQEEPPRHPTLVPELQPLPEIPPNTPAILGDLVKCLAEDMGLDDLNLMDLRSLDPPAALGPSLIMLFGTARSERHLHISAGRLKSWLRKKGFNADADGLIGRKDFKIALRRRQRKAKLLGTTPSPAESGLTTRWICMNLGTIEYQSTEEMPFESDNGIMTGFGVRQTGGTTIVVQMFTESKRKELELELLWSRILARRGNKLLVEDDLEYAEADAHPNEVSIFTEGGSPKVIAKPSQRRFFSTSCRRLSPPDESNQVTNPSTPTSASSSVDISLDPVKDLAAKVADLEQMQMAFSGFSLSTAVEALSPSEGGRQSNWIGQWNAAVKYLAPEQSWRFRLWLVAAGRKLGIQAYTLDLLRDLVQEMEILGIICERGQYLELLQAVYLDQKESNTSLAEQSDLALDILNIMFERGEPIITTDVFVSLLESLARTNSPSKEKNSLQSVLEKFMLQADLPYIGEAGVLRLLDAYAAQDNWDRWGDIWRMAPQHGLPRSQRLYIHMWTTMAATQNQRRCREALRSYFFEMLNEQPPVNAEGAVKEAMEACMRVADPQAEELAKKLIVVDERTARAVEAEFVHMWRVLNPEWVTGWRGQ